MEAGQQDGSGGRRLSRLIWFLLIVMALDVARSAVQQNVSFLDLQRYAHLREVSPYQERILMAAPIRAAEASPAFNRLFHVLFGKTVDRPESLVLIISNCACLVCMLPLTVAVRRSFSPKPMSSWLAPLVLLWIVTFTYVVRYEQRFALPYDFPSLLFYNLGLFAILRQRGWLLLVVLAVAIPNRETAIFLVAPMFLLFWREGRRIAALAFSVAAFAIFVFWRFEIAHRLGSPAQVYYFPVRVNLLAMLLPLHWPQLLSVFGFLALPLLALRRELQDRRLRDLWLASSVFLAGALAVGIWWETRIFGELSVLAAVTFAMQLESLLKNNELLSTQHAVA